MNFFEKIYYEQELGNNLRVGNESGAINLLNQFLGDPSAREVIQQADYNATQHLPIDNAYHGHDDQGVDTVRVNPNSSVDLVNRDTGNITPVGQLKF